MFSSVSSCAPNSQAITEFVSNADQTLDIWANITVAVNSTVITTRPIAIKTNDRVRATIATPAAHLGYRFIPYTLSGRQQCFAVVNRNNYTPTVKTTESVKKWYNYPVTVIEHSWSDGSNLDTSYIGGGVRQTIDIDQLHVKLKHRSNAVDLYGIGQASIATIGLPAGPIDYRKVNLVQPSGTYTQELLVLCNDGKLYRIDFKSNVTVTEQFNPGTINTFNFDDLPYQEDVPGSNIC